MKKFTLSLATVVLFLSSPSSLWAQRSPSQEVYKILGISVEGNTLSDPAAIIANSGLKAGDEITVPGDQLGQAIHKLWSLKIFDDIQIGIERKVGDGAYLLISVKELPRYERIEFEGRDEISQDDIMKKLGLIRGQVFPRDELSRIQKVIIKMYQDEGYLLAQVKATEEPIDSAKNRVMVRVDIHEGKEVQVDHIRFEGNHAFDDGDLRGAMDNTSEKHWWKFWSSAKFDKKKFQDDKKLIVDFYKNHGYTDADILSDTMTYSPDKTNMDILIRLHEGPQYHVRSIAWTGNTVYSSDVLNQRLSIAPGEVFDADKFDKNLHGNEAQSSVADLYQDNGYLRLNLEPVVTRVPGDSVDIAINVYEMNQYKVGHVNIKGNTKTQEKVIRRELQTVPGEYFNRGKVIRSVRQLSVLNYFNPEKIKPDVNLVDDKTVDLSYEVEEKSSDNVNASVGYSGAFGFTGALGFTINNFSISEPFTGGAGQILDFEWQFGEANIYRTFSLGFTEPWLNNTPTLLGVTLFDTRTNYGGVDIQRTGASVRVGRRFKWPDDYFRGDWIVDAQRNNVREGAALGYILGLTSQVSVTQVISRSSIDNPIFPTSGSNVSLSIQMSGGPVLPGNVDFHKWLFQSEWYLPVFNSSKVALYLNSQYGFVSPFSGTGNIQYFDMFFMGGTGLGYIATTALRGYDDQSVGPRNSANQIVGGRAMTKQTAELRFAVALNPIPIYVLGFAEGGNVFEDMSKADFFDLKRSAGFGARIQINPIGLIGFDYGYGFDDIPTLPGQPSGWHFHFVFGRGF